MYNLLIKIEKEMEKTVNEVEKYFYLYVQLALGRGRVRQLLI